MNLFRTNAPDDRFLIEAMKRWKGLPFSGLFKENFVALGAPERITLTIRTAEAVKTRASFRAHPAEAAPAPEKVAELVARAEAHAQEVARSKAQKEGKDSGKGAATGAAQEGQETGTSPASASLKRKATAEHDVADLTTLKKVSAEAVKKMQNLERQLRKATQDAAALSDRRKLTERGAGWQPNWSQQQ